MVLALILAAAAPAGAASVTPAVRATNGLALSMLGHLAPDANAVVSPYSVETALAMVDQGARGETAAQLDTLLGHATSPASLAAANGALGQALGRAVSVHGAGGPTLDSANGLWVQSGLSLDSPFSLTLSHDFGAAPQETSFAADPAAAVQAINAWVSRHTSGLIPALMSPEDVSPHTELVLANAVYLNARWQTPFAPDKTHNGAFAAPRGTVTVPFMHSSALSTFPYTTGTTGTAGTPYTAVALPYAHSSLQLLAVMPPAGRLDALQASLSPSGLNALAARLHRTSVDLAIPKFTLAFQSSLNGFLQSQGVTQAFGPASALDQIVRGRNLEIDAVEHAARLTIAEKGTVAAAATGVSAGPTAIGVHGVTLSLDHPFLIFLRDTATQTVLFAGRVEDPSAR